MTTFVTSDTHFGHVGVTQFTDKHGNKIRPYTDVNEMNEDMIEKWNAVVGTADKVIHVGDVVMNRRFLKEVMPRLNGRKILVGGNHDIFPLKDFLPHFEDIKGVFVNKGLVFTHIPIHVASMNRWGCNVHGHYHTNRVRLPDGEIDPRYFNVCVEQTNFTPISMEELKRRVLAQGGAIERKSSNAE